MPSRESGFTLIEVMIVVAIVAILAAIAMPIYRSFTGRAQSTEALSLASGLKPGVVEYYNEHGRFPSGTPANASINAASSTSITGRYVASVTVTGAGRIVALYCTLGDAGCAVDPVLSGVELTLSPVTHSGSIDWRCRVDDPRAYRFVPPVCRRGS